MSDIQRAYNDLVQQLSVGMRFLNTDRPKIKNLLNLFLKYDVFMANNSEYFPVTAILDFTNNNKIPALSILPNLAEYFTILSSKFGYVYEDPDNDEYILAEICRDRSGLEIFMNLFQPRIIEYGSHKFDNWYHIAGIPTFDKLLKEKLKKNPILRRSRIPENVPESHWWWQHPSDW